MPYDVDMIPSQWTAFRARWQERDERIRLMDSVVRGDWDELDPEDDEIENRSPNLIQVALEDTAESSALMPSVRAVPSAASESAKRRAGAMEQLAASYMDISEAELLQIESLLHYYAFGFFVWSIVFDPELGTPRIELRDPRTCYPEPGHKPGDPTRRCMFARDLYISQLPDPWINKLSDYVSEIRDYNTVTFLDREVVLVEVYTEDEIVVVALYNNGVRQVNATITYHPIELERYPTAGGICPVVIGQRITLDGEPRGQFDQVVNVLQGHIRLMGMVMDYADQSVYSDVWVKDLIGQMPYGGGAYIQLGPNGSIGRVPPAVSSLSVFENMSQLVDSIHLGGRWPKSRPGEVDQAIASAKFIEASAGVMNTVIRTAHLVMKRAWEAALRIAFLLDAEHGAERTIAGVLRNQQFLSERKKSDIDLKARVRVEYGLGFGRDPAQTMVLGIQASQSGFVSKEFVQENFEGITDVERERRRIDVQQLKDMALAQLLQGLQDKTIPGKALVDIAQARENGDDIFSLFKKYVVDPAEEQAASMVPTGLGGMVPPGMEDPMAGGPMPPAPPPPDELLGGLLGGAPGGGEPPQSISRLSVPLGDGSFAGTQVG